MIYKNISTPVSVLPLLPLSNMDLRRKDTLDTFRQKQPFRVAIGKSKWLPYEQFNLDYNLREILNDELVIELDTNDRELAWQGIRATGINLTNANINYSVWDHGGRSPHLHIHDLPIIHLEQNKRSLFKKFLIKKFVPEQYLKYVDMSLTGIHLISIEYQQHWKGIYGIKQLIYDSNGITKLVRFLQAVPKFIGTDGNIYGAFVEEDVANIPTVQANLLIEKQRAEVLE